MTHGHVKPNSDGSKARCGGPGICSECLRELAHEMKVASLEKDTGKAPRRFRALEFKETWQNFGAGTECVEASAYVAIEAERDELKATLKHDVDKIEAQYVSELQRERRKVQKLREQRDGFIKDNAEQRWERGHDRQPDKTIKETIEACDAELEAIDKGEG